MAKPVRRIVTGHDAEGHSIILADGPAPTVMTMATNTTFTDLWETTQIPASNAGHEDASLRPVRLMPQKNGSIFRIVEFPPDSERNLANLEAALAAIGAADAVDHGTPRHPGFHKTNTVDCVVVLEGEIWAMMDLGEALLKTGDVLVQRGTNHSWSNRSDRVCRFAVAAASSPQWPLGAMRSLNTHGTLGSCPMWASGQSDEERTSVHTLGRIPACPASAARSLESVLACWAGRVAEEAPDRPVWARQESTEASRRGHQVPPSASAIASMTASQPAHTVTVRGPHGQGMEWGLDFWLPNLLGDFGTSTHMISGIAPLVHAPGVGVGWLIQLRACLTGQSAEIGRAH